eukprot:m.35585 g.35585  ORF g.35585 m.35585 type:complete len:75 (+) comp8904_c0_seq1:423-647(+)
MQMRQEQSHRISLQSLNPNIEFEAGSAVLHIFVLVVVVVVVGFVIVIPTSKDITDPEAKKLPLLFSYILPFSKN